MSAGRLHIRKDNEKALLSTIKELADASSRNIYVYRYGKPVAVKKRIKASRRRVVWAVRVEGTSEPVPRDFRSKETAIKFAESLKSKGQGDTVLVD